MRAKDAQGTRFDFAYDGGTNIDPKRDRHMHSASLALLSADEIRSGGEALQPVSTATTVRVKNGKTLTTDGPFAETREQLGGFYLVEAKDLDEAISLAKGIPSARTGSIEVRPIMPTPPVE
jgi:hypothetical protein